MRFCIEVFNRKATLVIFDSRRDYTEDRFDFAEPALLEELKARVLAEHHSSLELPGFYFPLTDESQALFERLMAGARRRRT
jgi:hypothetical protein